LTDDEERRDKGNQRVGRTRGRRELMTAAIRAISGGADVVDSGRNRRGTTLALFA